MLMNALMELMERRLVTHERLVQILLVLFFALVIKVMSEMGTLVPVRFY